jgi:hypothetical protein
MNYLYTDCDVIRGKLPMKHIYPVLLLLVLTLAGCGEGAVVFAPTPLPPDIAPSRYEHPTGVFSITLPRDWPVYERSTPTLASAHFTPPGTHEAILAIAVINMSEVQELTTLVNSYQREARPDISRYTEQDRQVMEDGSWRLTGIRVTPGGLPQQVNTFIEQSGTLISVIEVIVPDDPARRDQLETIVNSFQANTSAELQPARISALTAAVPGKLEIVNITSWATAEGVFFVTGEVSNYSQQTLQDIPVRVELQTDDGVGVVEALDTVMGYAVSPGGFAPFSLRFGQGQPEETTRFLLTLGEPVETSGQIYGSETLTWTDSSSFSDEGHLLIDGTVTNTSPRTVRAPLATVTVFDIDRNIIATGFTLITEARLRPDENMDFHLRISEMGGEPVNYIVNIQALADF